MRDVRYELARRGRKVIGSEDNNILGRRRLGEVYCGVGGSDHCVAGALDDDDCALSVAVGRVQVKELKKTKVYATDACVDLLSFARHGLEQRIHAKSVKVRAGKVERTLVRDAR